MTSTLTPRQKEVYEFLVQRINEDRRAPTVREIGEHFGIASPNGVLCHLEALKRKGLIRQLPGKCRAIEVVSVASREAAERAVVKAAVELVEATPHEWGDANYRLVEAVREYKRLGVTT